MTEGAVVVGMVGVVFGLILGGRWARMNVARSGWSTARAGVPKAKAARKAAQGKFWLAWRAAMFGALIVFAYAMVIMKSAR
jgi:hypothetical protein